MKKQFGISRRGLGRSGAVLGGILFSVGAAFLYQKLTALQVGADAGTYSLSFTVLVVLCAAAAYIFAALWIIRFLESRRDPAVSQEEPLETEQVQAADCLSDEEPDEAYVLPDPPAEDLEETAAGLRARCIASALASQRGAQEDLPVQEERFSKDADGWDALYAPSAFGSEEDAAEKLYADLPTQLPPGYTLPPELSEEEEAPLEEEAEDEEEEIADAAPAPAPSLWMLLPAVCTIFVFAAVLVVAASFWTCAGADGIRVARLGSVQQYGWDQIVSYTVDAELSDGEILLTFQMEDGRQIKIAPASYVETGAFSRQYKSIYQYWLYVDHLLTARGADKTVSRAEYLADTYRTREDESWEYVRQIIGYEDDFA